MIATSVAKKAWKRSGIIFHYTSRSGHKMSRHKCLSIAVAVIHFKNIHHTLSHDKVR